MGDDFDLGGLKIDPDDPTLVPARGAVRSGHKAQRYFIKVPLAWLEKLEGASGKTWALALRLLFLHWRARSGLIRLSNVTAKQGGITRWSKWRALEDLESRGLITVERRSKRSPVVHVHAN